MTQSALDFPSYRYWASWKLFSPLFSLLHSLCALIAVSLWWCVPSWSRPALRSPLWPCPLALFNWQVKPLIWIESVIEKFSHSRVEIKVKVSDAHPQCCVLIRSSSPFTQDNLVFMTHPSQRRSAICLQQPPRSRKTSCGVPHPDDLLHMHLRQHFYLAVSSSAGAESV